VEPELLWPRRLDSSFQRLDIPRLGVEHDVAAGDDRVDGVEDEMFEDAAQLVVAHVRVHRRNAS
jgi:hypothetical protein